MPLVLDLIYLLALTLLIPWLVWRAVRTGRYREGFAEKLFGRVPRRIGDRPCVWFHAVSVGEVRLLRPVLDELARRRPDWEVFLSTTTAAGLAVARGTYPDLVTFHAPLDFSWATRRAVARVRPTVFALVELELWPNWIRAAKRGGARVAVVNGRLSARSHRGYRRLRPLLRPTMRRLDAVAAQTPEYAQRFVDLGVPADRVHVTGSMKYDGLELDRRNDATLAMRARLGVKPTDLVLVAGSTMEGEELAALETYLALKPEHPNLKLIVVPRHPHRFDEVAALLESRGETPTRRSALPDPGDPAAAPAGSATAPAPAPGRVILLDTLGELSAVWGLADVAFVGGSLFPGRGGQNMIEPAAFGACVLFGPHTENFRATVSALLERDAARVVHSPAELTQAVREALEDPETAAERGEAARAFVLTQQGATQRTLSVLDELAGDEDSDSAVVSRARLMQRLAAMTSS